LTTLRIETPRWAKPLLQPARYKGAHGGRGSGKSHFFAEYIVEQHIIDPNESTVCVREIQKSLDQSVKRLLENKIQSMNAGTYFDVQDARIKSQQGSGLIIFQGMQNHTAESIKSLEGYRRAWVEEGQSLSQTSLDLLRPTIFRLPNSEMLASWNPKHGTDPIDKLLRGTEPPPESIVVSVNWADNPWFPDSLKQEMEYDRKRDRDKYLHVWEGQYQSSSEARVFRNWTVEEFDIKPDWILRQGADWGFSVDPSVIVQCAIEGRKLYVTHEAYRIGCEIDMLPDLFLTVPNSERWPTIADSARPETISYMQRHGFPKMMAAVKGAKSLEEGVEFLKSFDIIVHPRCKHTIDELNHYSYKVDPLTEKVLPVLEDKDNHVIDSLRYACEGARRAKKPVQTVEIIPTAHHWR
jgi:phage terminase large subunit